MMSILIVEERCDAAGPGVPLRRVALLGNYREGSTMLTPAEVESLNFAIGQMSRDAVAKQLRDFPSRFPLDFTEHFLLSESLPHLRHILFGLYLHHRRPITPVPICLLESERQVAVAN